MTESVKNLCVYNVAIQWKMYGCVSYLEFIEMEFGTTEKRHKNNINLGTPGERGWEEIVVGFDISIKRYCAF